MATMINSEQPIHDEINLRRLVRRLQKSISDGQWDESFPEQTWIQAQVTLQKVKYARKLLNAVEDYYLDPAPRKVQWFNETRMTLDRVGEFAKEVETRTTPQTKRPEPILPHIPLPLLPPAETLIHPGDASPSASSPDPASGTSEAPPGLPTDSLLLSPSDAPSQISPSFPIRTLIPPSFASATKSPAAAAATGAAARSLQNSTALQQDLADQLAQMAVQLRRNAQHFSASLARDQDVVQETREKLEGNFDVMQKERLRLRDHRGKSRSTTCLTLLIVVVVLLLFVLGVAIIRLT